MEEDKTTETNTEEMTLTKVKCLYCCWTVRPESFYKYYTLILTFGHIMDFIYYGILIFHGIFEPRLFGLVYHSMLFAFLLYSYWRYMKENNYGLAPQYYYSAIVYYFSLFLWIITFLLFNFLAFNGKYDAIIHRKLYVYQNELAVYLALIYLVFFPFSLFNLYLKKMYFEVIKERKLFDANKKLEELNYHTADSMQESLM